MNDDRLGQEPSPHATLSSGRSANCCSPVRAACERSLNLGAKLIQRNLSVATFFTTAIFSSLLPPFHIEIRRVTTSQRKGIRFFPLLLHSKLQFPQVFFSLLCGGYLSSRATQSNYRSIKGFRDQSFCQQFSHGRLRGFYRVRVNEISFHVEISRGKALKKRIYGKGSPVFLLVCQSLHTW